MKKPINYNCPKCGRGLFGTVEIKIKKNPSKKDKICPAPSGGFWAFNDLEFHCNSCGFFIPVLDDELN